MFDKPIGIVIAIVVLILLLVGGYFGYKHFSRNGIIKGGVEAVPQVIWFPIVRPISAIKKSSNTSGITIIKDFSLNSAIEISKTHGFKFASAEQIINQGYDKLIPPNEGYPSKLFILTSNKNVVVIDKRAKSLTLTTHDEIPAIMPNVSKDDLGIYQGIAIIGKTLTNFDRDQIINQNIKIVGDAEKKLRSANPPTQTFNQSKV